ncbi:MAG: carboxyl transferase domain-containing protein, partial [Nannocystaceae bacterium]
MPTLESLIDTTSETFCERREQQLAALAKVRTLEQAVIANSSSKAAKFAKRGQLLPRERVMRLLDPGAPFIELSTLAGCGMHDDNGKTSVSGGNNISGIGYVSGVRCMIGASDSAIKGGSIPPMGLRKSLRAQEIALQNRLPLITLAESAG